MSGADLIALGIGLWIVAVVIIWAMCRAAGDADALAEAQERQRQHDAKRLRAVLDEGECEGWPVRSMSVGAASDFHAENNDTPVERKHAQR